MPKYLMFDHGGVLDGSFIHDLSEADQNDLVLQKYSKGGYQVLKNGVLIVEYLNRLVNEHDFKIVFHSKNNEKDQISLLEQLENACKQKGILFPQVVAMGVYDQKKYDDIHPKTAKFDYNKKHHIQIAGYGVEGDGKSCLRTALEKLLMINPSERFMHAVFDDGPSIILQAKSEGYNSYRIGDVELESVLKQILEFSLNQKKQKENVSSPSSQLFTLYSSSRQEMPSDPDFKAIQDLKIEIDKELLSSVCVNRNRKMHKARFFDAVMQRYLQSAGRESIKDCITFYQNQFPDNYKESIKGFASARTKNVFETILTGSIPKFR